MFFRPRSIVLIGLLLTALAMSAVGQVEQQPAGTPEKAADTPEKTPKPTPLPKTPAKITTADQAIEAAIFLYGYPGGRATLNQIRKTTLERGTSAVTNAEGKIDQTNYNRYIIRAETLGKEKIRLDQEFPSATYAMVYNEGKIFGIYNNSVFQPREDAAKGFAHTIFHGIEALLRYKENESKIELASKEKLLGVEYFVIDVTDKEGRKTRFYVSAKSFRVMMLTYEEDGVKYTRRFYDYNYAQGTLVPFKTILWANDKEVENSEVGTMTFGQKVDEQLFSETSNG